MATYYVYSGATLGANTGGSWTDAYLTYGQAVTAATSSGDIIKVHVGHTEDLSTDTTFTFTANVRTLCVDKDNSDALAVMGAASGYIGHTSLNRGISISGAFNLYFYGITLRVSGATTENLYIGSLGDGLHYELESCYLWLENSASISRIALCSGGSASRNAYIKTVNCIFRFGATTQRIICGAAIDMVGCSISSSGTAPAQLFSFSVAHSGGAYIYAIGCDFSFLGSGYVVDDAVSITADVVLANCKLGTSFVLLSPQSSANKSGASVMLLDSSDGDQHYQFAYSDPLGDLTVSTGIYANDGASYDGTNRYSWKIVTSAGCSFYSPFVTPWIEKYHSATSAITPYIEILRDGSATAYQDDEVWGEFSCKTTANSTLASVSNDRMTVLGTPANQTASSLGSSDWTGENATAWFGKLVAPSSITPAEIGMLMARVIVGEPSITVYVDPTIRT